MFTDTALYQDMKNKVGVALEYKNKGIEEMQIKDLKAATRFFHLALLHVKGISNNDYMGPLFSNLRNT